MKKRVLGFAVVVAALLGPVASAAVASLPPASKIRFEKDVVELSQGACADNPTGTAVRVRVAGLKSREGFIRVQLYNGTEAEFLEKGRWLVRMQGPVPAKGPVVICLPLQAVGKPFGIVVRHDSNGNSKSDLTEDGFGVSNNPKLGLSKPKATAASFIAQPGIVDMAVTVNYLSGFSMKPVKNPID